MKLFHGSDTVVRGPLANVGRAKVDYVFVRKRS